MTQTQIDTVEREIAEGPDPENAPTDVDSEEELDPYDRLPPLSNELPNGMSTEDKLAYRIGMQEALRAIWFQTPWPEDITGFSNGHFRRGQAKARHLGDMSLPGDPPHPVSKAVCCYYLCY